MSWKDFFKSKEQKAVELAALEQSIRLKVEEEISFKRNEEDRIKSEYFEQLIAQKMQSSIPWYEEIQGTEDKIFVHERYRWNTAFIKDLLKKGHKGETDSEIFQSFITEQERIERREVIDNERQKRLDSDEPWVEIVGENIQEGRIELQLEWNNAFIKYLRSHGFTGKTEEQLVHQWLAHLDKDMENLGEFH